jgi:7-cyano-7-deazaguanine synthase
MSKPKAIILLSGGLDSSTVLAIAQDEGFDAYAISFKYGQRHEIELEAARRIAKEAGVREHVEAAIDLRMFGGSALTSDVEVPKKRAEDELGAGIPITYVPARNTVFLSFGLAWAEVLEADHVWIGVNAVDYSGYPDCRPEYVAAYEQMANLATRRGVEGHRMRIRTPLIDLTKAQIIQRGLELGVDYGLTLSCYDPSPSGESCGECDACVLRLRGFEQNGVVDPAPYVSRARAA